MIKKLFVTFLFCLIPYSAQAQFANDNFNRANSNLNGSTSTSGHTWTETSGTNLTVVGNKVSNDGGTSANTNQTAILGATPPSADYSVTGETEVGTTSNAANQSGVVCRKQSGVDTYYACEMFGGVNGSRGWRIIETTTGTDNAPGGAATYLNNWVANTQYTTTIECIGTTIKCYVDEVERATHTDSSITLAGSPGIELKNTNGNFSRVDDFAVVNLTPAAAEQGIIIGEKQ